MVTRLDALIDNKIAQNLFIWLLLFLILLATIQADNRWLAALFVIILLAPPVYINNIYILPYIQKNRRIFVGLFLANLILWNTILVYILTSVLKQEYKWTMWINFVGVLFLALSFSSTIKLARDSFYRRQQEKDAELKLLKAQLNPHFLFNTLNNLYGLSVIKSNKLPGLMLTLSDLLRYSLYDTQETLVPLDKEIQYIENYVSLEKIRLESTAKIQFDKNGDTSSTQIAPMLLIVFVENAFKYLDSSTNSNSSVSISVTTTENEINFKCSNTYTSSHSNLKKLEIGNSGIGLQNAKKRLGLIYPDKHRLEIKSKDEKFIVELTLQVKS
ncbi:histidine kinase [Aquimarina sp. D1M17]|uniref:sensor histidine kinase n=1 Tax=Aquimarina acroporae TaxID=2937283 RepID=UPI0020BF45CC|nr:sensor histidine kinase [Aquimarina acroporae]MCK8523631.1 histidine kinase [Aquimarina acroporae]